MSSVNTVELFVSLACCFYVLFLAIQVINHKLQITLWYCYWNAMSLKKWKTIKEQLIHATTAVFHISSATGEHNSTEMCCWWCEKCTLWYSWIMVEDIFHCRILYTHCHHFPLQNSVYPLSSFSIAEFCIPTVIVFHCRILYTHCHRFPLQNSVYPLSSFSIAEFCIPTVIIFHCRILYTHCHRFPLQNSVYPLSSFSIAEFCIPTVIVFHCRILYTHCHRFPLQNSVYPLSSFSIAEFCIPTVIVDLWSVPVPPWCATYLRGRGDKLWTSVRRRHGPVVTWNRERKVSL